MNPEAKELLPTKHDIYGLAIRVTDWEAQFELMSPRSVTIARAIFDFNIDLQKCRARTIISERKTTCYVVRKVFPGFTFRCRITKD